MAKKKMTTRPGAAARNPKIPVWIWGIAAIALIAVIAVIALLSNPPAAANTAPESAAQAGMPLEVSVTDAASRRMEGAFILDVRQPEEWEAGHIPDATLIPLGELSNRLDEVPQDQEVVVVCRSGNRSAQGRDILLNAGFSSVTSMAGGMNDWQAQGLPVVTGP